MDYTVIQEHVNRLSSLMVAKGLREPEVRFYIESNREMAVVLRWQPLKKKTAYELGRYEYVRGGTPGEMIAKAEAFILALPNADETKFREFMAALGGVIDLGKENGIEVEFLNPLTFQPA